MGNLDEGQKKQFDFAADVTKQMLSLSTGTVALTITFAKDVFKTTGHQTVLVTAWAVETASILLGLMTLMGLTGVLSSASPHVYSTSIRVAAIGQSVSFLAGIVLLLVYGALAMP